ncbi:hypothetical protein [Acidihalobacter ferrooxydans]|uniref:hypothetical protein n=1 Tax=Acidihalobacter ferrooxydans TaxID=1765967 RepID=UPI0012EC170D|nr:hypothetical protein [Acidihalobacter ferrooxydans]
MTIDRFESTILKMAARFVPINENREFDRGLLWEHPLRYLWPNALGMAFGLAVHSLTKGMFYLPLWGDLVALIFSPMFGAATFAFVLGKLGFNGADL